MQGIRNILFFMFLCAMAAPVMGQDADETTANAQNNDPRENIAFADMEAVVPGTVPVTLFPAADQDEIALQMDEEGYVFTSLGDTDNDFSLYVEIYDPLGRMMGVNAARIDFPGRVRLVVRDRWNNFSSPDPFPLVIETKPEVDLNEPNDQPEQAFPLTLDAWNDVVLLPVGDVDYFSFDVPAKGTIVTDIRDAPFAIAVAIRPADTPDFSDGWTAAVEPGKYFLKIQERWGSAASETPFPVRLRFVPDPPSTPTELSLSLPAQVWLARSDLSQKFTLKVPQFGLYTIRLDGPVPNDAKIFVTPADDTDTDAKPQNDGTKRFEKYLAKGVYEIDVRSGSEGAKAPFYLIAEAEVSTDASEPNDTPQNALALKTGEETPVTLYPYTDSDWISLKAKGRGNFYLRVQDLNRDDGITGGMIEVFFLDQDGKRKPLSVRPGTGYDIFGPVPVDKKDIKIELKNRGYTRWIPLMVTPVFTAEGEKADSTITLIGVELNENQARNMKALAMNAGVDFVLAESASDLDQRLKEATAGKRKFPWWLLVLLVLIGTGYYFWRRKQARA